MFIKINFKMTIIVYFKNKNKIYDILIIPVDITMSKSSWDTCIIQVLIDTKL